MKLQASAKVMTFLHDTSLMSDGQQLVDVAGTHSATAQSTYGVPLMFILGSLLCLIYVNDMSAILRNKLLLYADESGILVSGKINLKNSLSWHESY
jgi:hypothetical protein